MYGLRVSAVWMLLEGLGVKGVEFWSSRLGFDGAPNPRPLSFNIPYKPSYNEAQ